LFSRPGKKHIELVDKALETVGMLDKADKQIGKLSGGQQQRVMIAKALVASPEVLILDEPAAAIDSENEQQLYHLLQRLNVDKKLTIIMVTHSIENVEQSMNKIYVIKNKLVTRRK
ncbi:zinc ABC transporter ATP-binding protein, partial [Lachnotalea glycerini]